MFKNLFKKQAPVKVEQKEVATMERTSNYPTIVEEIHNEFETAADKLAESAKQIIAEARSKDASKVERLINLGFKHSNQVSEVKPLLEKAKLSEEQIKLLNDYAKKYPFNKFITEGQVEVVCKKYNLVCGEVDRYKGFVPEKNLREVERFSLKGNDGREIMYQYGSKKQTLKEWYITNSEGFVKNNVIVDNNVFLGDVVGLKICAPVKEMDLQGLELKDGYKLEKKHVPDPVVLQPVNGGYLIVTKWGDEASDPLLTNPIEN
jgi:hypothetical protein